MKCKQTWFVEDPCWPGVKLPFIATEAAFKPDPTCSGAAASILARRVTEVINQASWQLNVFAVINPALSVLLTSTCSLQMIDTAEKVLP